jgi:hypothetical protein
VPPCERIRRRAMIERGSLPAIGRVALRAGLTKLSVVFVTRLVTGNAALGGPRVLVARMA